MATATCPNTTTAVNASVGLAVPAGYTNFNLALFILYLLYVPATIGAWWLVVHREQRPYLQKRSFALMAISGCSGIIEFVIVPLREVVTPALFPCDWYLWLNTFFIPLLVGPIVLQLAIFSYKAEFNSHVGALDNAMLVSVFKNVNVAAITSKHRRTTIKAPGTLNMLKRKSVRVGGSGAGSNATPSSQTSNLSSAAIQDMTALTNADSIIEKKHRTSDRNAARLVVLFMVFPAIVIGAAISFSAPEYGHGCVGCTSSTTELAVFLIEGIYMIGMGVYYWYKTRHLRDPWYILRGTRNVLAFGFVVGLIGVGLSTLDPFGAYAAKSFAWGWIVCASVAGMHTLFCVLPVSHSRKAVVSRVVWSRDDFERKLQHSPEFHQAFRTFSLELFTIENIVFWDFATALLKAPQLDTSAKAMIDSVFIGDDAPMQLNLSSDDRDTYLAEGDWRKALDGASKAMLKLMHSDTLPKFFNTAKGKEFMTETA